LKGSPLLLLSLSYLKRGEESRESSLLEALPSLWDELLEERKRASDEGEKEEDSSHNL